MNPNVSRVVDKLSKELGKMGYYFNTLAPMPISPEIAEKYIHVIEIDVLIRAVATCEIEFSYYHRAVNHFDEKIYNKVFNGTRTVNEYLTLYWLWQILGVDKEEAPLEFEDCPKFRKASSLQSSWKILKPLLLDLDFIGDANLLLNSYSSSQSYEKIIRLKLSFYLSLALAVIFVESENDIKNRPFVLPCWRTWKRPLVSLLSIDSRICRKSGFWSICSEDSFFHLLCLFCYCEENEVIEGDDNSLKH